MTMLKNFTETTISMLTASIPKIAKIGAVVVEIMVLECGGGKCEAVLRVSHQFTHPSIRQSSQFINRTISFQDSVNLPI